MSNFGESAGVYAAGEVAGSTDDSDPSGKNLKPRQLAWDNPDHGLPDPEYEAFIERQYVRQLSSLVDSLVEAHGETVSRQGETEMLLDTATARLSRVGIKVGDYIETVTENGELTYEYQETGSHYAYFFVDLTHQYEEVSFGRINYYCRSWTSDSERINYCRQESRHEPAVDVQARVEKAFEEFMPKEAEEEVAPPPRRRLNLDFLLKRNRR